jgi:hypothetical protein
VSDVTEGYFVVRVSGAQNQTFYISKTKVTNLSASAPYNLDMANFNSLGSFNY